MKRYKLTLSLVIILFLCVGYTTLNELKYLDKHAFVVAVGDNLIHPVVYNDARQQDGTFDFSQMYQPVEQYIQSADIAYMNQESPMGGDDKAFSGFKRFNTPSQLAQNVVESGFNLINGANNHALDQGTDGLEHQIDVWKRHRTMYTGTFKSSKDRNNIPIKKVKGIKVAMLSYTYGTNGLKRKAPYHVNYFKEEVIKRDIAKARKLSDVIVVSAHWGKEGKSKPSNKQRHFAQLFADEGVDVVLGMHPHVIQPVEWVEGKHGHRTLVAYSLGNFLNGQETGDEKNILGGSVNFDINKSPKGVSINDVRWKSLVIHNEIVDPDNSDSRYNFAVYPLHRYSTQLADKHAVQFKEGSEMSVAHLQQHTRSIIDKQFLTPTSY